MAGYHRRHAKYGKCYTEHSLRKHSLAWQQMFGSTYPT